MRFAAISVFMFLLSCAATPARPVIKQRAQLCPEALSLWPVHVHKGESSATSEFYMTLTSKLSPALQKVDIDAGGMIALNDAQRDGLTLPKLNTVWVVDAKKRPCRLKLGALFLHMSSSDLEPRVVGRLTGKCEGMEDAEARFQVGVAATSVGSSCRFSATITSPPQSKYVALKRGLPKMLQPAFDQASCEAPGCKLYSRLKWGQHSMGEEVLVAQSARVKFNAGLLEEMDEIRARDEDDDDIKYALSEKECDADITLTNTVLWRKTPTAVWQSVAGRAHLPDFYGWLIDASGARAMIFEEHGYLVVMTRQGDTWKKTQAIDWMVPHAEDEQSTVIGPSCEP